VSIVYKNEDIEYYSQYIY